MKCIFSLFYLQLQESEENNIQVERRVNTLMGTLDEKERDLICTGQKLQEVLAATTRSEQTIKQLEEAVQRYRICTCNFLCVSLCTMLLDYGS